MRTRTIKAFGENGAILDGAAACIFSIGKRNCGIERLNSDALLNLKSNEFVTDQSLVKSVPRPSPRAFSES